MTASPEPELRVVVVDDQASVREGLVLLLDLTPGVTVVASAANGAEALDLVAEHEPDAVLLDLHMPGMDGVEVATLLTARQPAVAIVVLTTFADDASILGALRAGARSYLTKDADRAEIVQALRSAASGLSVLAPSVQAALLAAVGEPRTQPTPRALPDGLTPREGEILGLLGSGLTNAEIAERLVVSRHTVKTHLNHIFAKTDSRDRAAAMTYAYRHNLATPPGPARS